MSRYPEVTAVTPTEWQKDEWQSRQIFKYSIIFDIEHGEEMLCNQLYKQVFKGVRAEFL